MVRSGPAWFPTNRENRRRRAVGPFMQTVRFAQVVSQAGRPQPYLTWLAPDRDRALKKLTRETRVLSIHQELRGTRKDFGSVGLHWDGSSQILIFPKSLARFAGKRVVGIDYDLIAPASHAAGPPVRHPRRSPDSKPRPPVRTQKPPDVQPGPARKQAAPARRPAPPPNRDKLLGGIRLALRDLQAGKAASAGRRLQKLIGRQP
jgi:hypothetical protein